MGGGTSGLYYGTKGSRQDYQYSLFPDLLRRDNNLYDYNENNQESAVGGSSTGTSIQTQFITVGMVMKKCQDYHLKRLTAQQLLEWLSMVIHSPHCRMERRLRNMISKFLRKIANHQSEKQEAVDQNYFEQQLLLFEGQLSRRSQ